MATKWLVVLWLVIVGTALPVSLKGSGGWLPQLQFLPFWFAVMFLAQIVVFRLFGFDVSKPREIDGEDECC